MVAVTIFVKLFMVSVNDDYGNDYGCSRNNGEAIMVSVAVTITITIHLCFKRF